MMMKTKQMEITKYNGNKKEERKIHKTGRIINSCKMYKKFSNFT